MSKPSARIPVPQSSTSVVPSLVRSSTQQVLPPNTAVPGPGVGIEPRVPQKRRCIRFLLFLPSRRILPCAVESRCSQCSMFPSRHLWHLVYPCAMREERPWGKFTVLDEGENYKVKRIEVLPGKRLSYQRHSQRAEHWVVVQGTAKVTLDDREIIVRPGEAIDISIGSAHRVENAGDDLLV